MNQMKININYISIVSLLCASLVPLLVTGPFLPDLIVSLLSLWFLYYSFKHKMYYIYRNPYFYAFISFSLVCILSSLLSDNILFSLKSSLFYFRIGIFALLISYLIDQNRKILDYFYYAFLFTFFTLVIDGYTQYLTGSNFFGYKLHQWRVSSFFGKELILGSYLARLFPLFLALFVTREKKNTLEIYGISILFIAIDVLIFLTGERTSFLFFNLSSLFIIIFISQYKWLRAGILVVSFIVIIFLTLNNSSLYERYIKSTKESLGVNSPKQYIFSPTHDSLIRTAWSMFLDKPIFGHGPRLFRLKCSDAKYAENIYSCNVHPHNFYLQLLAETGIIGFLFLAGLFSFFVYLVIRHILQYLINKKLWLSDYQVCLLAGLLITIWPLSTNGNIFTNHLMIIYSLQMGFFRKNVN
jgi:O-antigen ligase